MIDRRRSRVLVAVALGLLASAGCDVIEEKIREGQKPPGSGAGPGGASGGGGPPAPAPPPAVVACASSAACPAGQRCSTESGACDRPPGCGPQSICPAVCYGVCEGKGKPDQPVPPGAICAADADCRLFSDYCTGCDCRALGKGEKDPVCAGPGVQCFVDPCRDSVAVCAKGRCAVKSTRPMPPPPPQPACTGDGEGSETTCRSTGEWKDRAYRACRDKGLELRNYWPAGDCGPDSYRYVKYECCGPTPVPPEPMPPKPTPPPPYTGACWTAIDGGPTSCKSPDTWKQYAGEYCAQKGAVLRDLSFDTECGGGNYRFMKYSCCSPEPAPNPQKCTSDDDCPKIRIACKDCGNGSASCPFMRCQANQCVLHHPPCSAPTPPAMPWDPCAKKKCGDTCTLCPPWPSNCAETKDIKTCNAGGKCVSGPPQACG